MNLTEQVHEVEWLIICETARRFIAPLPTPNNDTANTIDITLLSRRLLVLLAFAHLVDIIQCNK